MKEFSLPIREELPAGLRRDSRSARGGRMGLAALRGLKPLPWGLVKAAAIATPIDGPAASWPFPQFFAGKEFRLLAAETTIYEVASDYSATAYTVYDAYLPTTTRAITAGGPWHFADHGKAWFLFNGNCVVFYTNIDGLYGSDNKVYVQDTITIRSGCHFRGRQVVGGFDPDNFWTADWEAFWSAMLAQQNTGIDTSVTMDTNYVMWSHIGGGDLLWQMFQEQAANGPIEGIFGDASYPLVMEYMQRRDAGFAPLPFPGSVYAILPLESAVMVYGEEGVAALTPGRTLDGIPTFGIRKLLPVGIASRGAAGGHEGRHWFVTADGWLWTIDADLKLERLGYKEFFSGMIGNEIMISHDPAEGETCISDDAAGYVLTPSGLAQANQKVISLGWMEGALAATDDDAAAVETFELTTDAYDAGNRSQKTVAVVEVAFTDMTSVQVRVEYKYSNSSDAWSQSDWIDANSEGVVYPNVACTDFRIGVKGTAGSAARLDSILVRLKQTDKRSIRGV